MPETENGRLLVEPFNSFSRSDEVTDIIERMPVKFGTWLTMLILFIVGILVLFGWIIKYPDTVSGPVVINANSAPIKLISNVNGTLNLLNINPKSIVKKGQYLAVINNSANTNDIRLLTKLLTKYKLDTHENPNIRINFPDKLEVGELNVTYFAFLTAYHQSLDYQKHNVIDKQKAILSKLNLSQNEALKSNYEELKIRKTMYDLVKKNYSRDSILHKKKVLSDADLERSNMNRLSTQENYVLINKDINSNLYQLDDIASQLQQLKVNSFDKAKQRRLELLNTYYNLVDEIQKWELKYVFKAPFNGKIEFSKFWHQGDFVNAGQEVMSVLPKENKISGQMSLPEKGSGKVKVGQSVIIKMDNYPYEEYGFIKGKVKSISSMPSLSSESTTKQPSNIILVTIDLPQGLKTNYGDKLDFKFEIKGNADIITKDRRLFHRLFDNLKYIVSKK